MAELIYNEHYFEMANPNIYENEELREPQIQGYFKVYDHFVVKNKQTHAIVVLPTGVGKTGLMGILPFHICNLDSRKRDEDTTSRIAANP